jgi:hypothetical protein
MSSIDKSKAKTKASGGTGHPPKAKTKASGGTGHPPPSPDVHTPTQFYDLVKKDPVLAKLYDYPNKPEIQIKLPCRILMVGGTGSGKTTSALEIIKVVGVFERIIVIAKLMDEDLYLLLKERAEIKAEKNDVPVE